MGKDRFWLFSAQSLFLGSLHTWLRNSLWEQWDCCRALTEGNPCGTSTMGCRGADELFGKKEPGKGALMAASMKCPKIWPSYSLLKATLVPSFRHIPGGTRDKQWLWEGCHLCRRQGLVPLCSAPGQSSRTVVCHSPCGNSGRQCPCLLARSSAALHVPRCHHGSTAMLCPAVCTQAAWWPERPTGMCQKGHRPWLSPGNHMLGDPVVSHASGGLAGHRCLLSDTKGITLRATKEEESMCMNKSCSRGHPGFGHFLVPQEGHGGPAPSDGHHQARHPGVASLAASLLPAEQATGVHMGCHLPCTEEPTPDLGAAPGTLEGEKLAQSLAWHGEKNWFIAAEGPHHCTLCPSACCLVPDRQISFRWVKHQQGNALVTWERGVPAGWSVHSPALFSRGEMLYIHPGSTFG